MPPPTRDEDTAPGNGMRVRMPEDARADTPDETLSEAEAHAVSDLLSRDLDPRTQPAQRSRRSSPDHDPILAAIEDVSRGRSGPDGVHRGPVRESAAEDFPDAFPVVMPRSNEELDALDRRLVTMTNRQVRRAAIATRDATDLSSPGVLKSDLNRGWVVLRAEAERRGVDLETGLQHIARATDPERAALHRDQEFLKTIDLQKELERQRLR